MIPLWKNRALATLACLFLLSVSVIAAEETVANKPIRTVYFSKDVPAIDPLSPAFDPDSYAIITQVFDSLVHFDLDGNIVPGLATEWHQVSPTEWHFTLRQGVTFHNGEPFDGRAVKFTYDTILSPEIKAGNAWILNIIDHVNFDPKSPFEVTIHTKSPDGMFLNRIPMFGSICPPGYTKEVGLVEFSRKPIGTGPYKLVAWHRDDRIELTKNDSYWQLDRPITRDIIFRIIDKEHWVDAFLKDEIDFVPNLDGRDTSRLMREAKGQATILKRLVLSGYWVMLRNQGPLADRRVRLALNHALNKDALVQFADLGNAKPMASIGKIGEFGRNPDLTPYIYDPEKSRSLLADAGITEPIKLNAIVADVAEAVAKIMKKDFSEVGIDLELEVVSRSEWSNKVVGYKIQNGTPPNYDLAINLVDNPTYNLAFHAGLFLDSSSPWSLLNSPEVDKAITHALKTSDKAEHERRLQELDRLVHEEALMVFTTQRIVTAAIKPDLIIPKFGLSGHLDYDVLSTAAYDMKELGGE